MLIELQDLGKSFGEHEVLKHVTASVERGDRIGIIGANGTGKTTLLRVLCGESLPDAGDAAFAAGATCGYLEQTGHLDPEKDVYETMRLAFQPALDAMAELETLQKQLAADLHNTAITDKITACNAVIDAMDAYNMDTQIKKVLNGMGFPADTWKKKAGVLSGGEQTRLRLARLLLERPDILILDEPTNHLDLETMDWLETYLKAYRGAVLVVSHDRYFLDSVCTRIWELRGKKRVHTYSSVLCWAACDRLSRIAQQLKLSDRESYWREEASRMHRIICENAWSEKKQAFVAAWGDDALDASMLLLHEFGFLPAGDSRFASTVAAIEAELKHGDFIYRYVEQDDFGTPDNAFLVCTFWYVYALQALGRKDEACHVFRTLLRCCNPQGLLAEDYCSRTGELWGNFVQTYSMVGLINCALRLSQRWDQAY